jgi:hypothetical protein
MPSGAGQSRRTKLGPIKGLFGAAKAVTQRDADAPKARKRRGGGSEGRLLAMRLRLLHTTKPAARRQYVRLAVRQFPPEDEFVSTAKLLCSAAQEIADVFIDLSQRLEAIIYGRAGLSLSDTLDWHDLWANNSAYDDQCLDDDFCSQQDRYSPQP